MPESSKDGPYIIPSRFRPEPESPLDISPIHEEGESTTVTDRYGRGSSRLSSEIRFQPQPLQSPEELAETIIRLNKLGGIRPQHRTETYKDWLAKQPKIGRR